MSSFAPYLIGLGAGILAMLLRIVPDFIFITVTVIFEFLGLLIYAMLACAGYLINSNTYGIELTKKLNEDAVIRPLYWECLSTAIFVLIFPIFFVIFKSNPGTYIWMTLVVTHTFLLWQLVYHFTSHYEKEIRTYNGK